MARMEAGVERLGGGCSMRGTRVAAAFPMAAVTAIQTERTGIIEGQPEKRREWGTPRLMWDRNLADTRTWAIGWRGRAPGHPPKEFTRLSGAVAVF